MLPELRSKFLKGGVYRDYLGDYIWEGGLLWGLSRGILGVESIGYVAPEFAARRVWIAMCWKRNAPRYGKQASRPW